MIDKKEVLTVYYAQNFDRLVKAWTKRAGSEMDAEDLVQEAFTRALKYLDNYDGISPFEGWFVTILNNCHKDLAAVNHRMGMSVELDEAEKLGLIEPEEMPTSNHRFLRVINKLIEGSNRPSRDVLYLHFIRGWNSKEISKYVEMSDGAVRLCIHRFRQLCKDVCGVT